MTKVLLSLIVVVTFAVLTGAQVAAPNPQGSNTLAQTVEKAADGTTLLRGNVGPDGSRLPVVERTYSGDRRQSSERRASSDAGWRRRPGAATVRKNARVSSLTGCTCKPRRLISSWRNIARSSELFATPMKSACVPP
jgi:hypothetical protein